MVARAVVLRALVEIVLELAHRRADFIAVGGARVAHRFEHGAHPAVAEGAVVRRHRAAMGPAELVVECLGGGDRVLQAPVIRGAAEHALEHFRPAGRARREQQYRGDEFRAGLEAEFGRLFHRVQQIAAEIAEQQNVRLERLDSRQKRRVVGRPQRMPDVGKRLDAKILPGALKPAHHLVPVGVVRGEEHHALAETLERVAPDRAPGQMGIEGFVKGVRAPILHFVDRVGLADRVVDDLALFGDAIDRQLHRRRQRADDEIHLVLLDQLERARRRLSRIELVVANQQFRHPPPESAAVVELLHRDLGGAHLVLRVGTERAGERNREADPDRRRLRPGDVEPERRRRGGGRAEQQFAPGHSETGRAHAVLLLLFRWQKVASRS